MHRFVEYISDLIFLHDCVIIPDFGAFICNYKSASIDESTGMIYPPAKEIIFNKSLKNNDGLLVNWISAKENLSYAQTIKQLEIFSEDLRIKLNQGKRVPFGDIGIFYTDRRFNIIFESGDFNFLADSFGMEKIEATKVRLSENIKTDKKQAVQQNCSSAKTIEIPSYQNEMHPYMNLESRNWEHKLMKYGLAVVVIGGLVLLSHLVYYHWVDNSRSELTVTDYAKILPTPYTNIIENQTMMISPHSDFVSYEPEINF